MGGPARLHGSRRVNRRLRDRGSPCLLAARGRHCGSQAQSCSGRQPSATGQPQCPGPGHRRGAAACTAATIPAKRATAGQGLLAGGPPAMVAATWTRPGAESRSGGSDTCATPGCRAWSWPAWARRPSARPSRLTGERRCGLGCCMAARGCHRAAQVAGDGRAQPVPHRHPARHSPQLLGEPLRACADGAWPRRSPSALPSCRPSARAGACTCRPGASWGWATKYCAGRVRARARMAVAGGAWCCQAGAEPASHRAGDAAGPVAGQTGGFLLPPLRIMHCDKMTIFSRRCAAAAAGVRSGRRWRAQP